MAQSQTGPTDVVDVILDEHEQFRTGFAHLEGAADADAQLRYWKPMKTLLETHAAAEEAVFYPAVIEAKRKGGEESSDAIREHNEIRDAIGEVEEHEPGSSLFLLAVRQVKAANDHHMAEEETEVLPAFRDQVDAAERARLGEQFLAFKREHPDGRGLSTENQDPDQYVAEHRS